MMTGRARGFGVVEMPDSHAAHSAMDALNGTRSAGRTSRTVKPLRAVSAVPPQAPAPARTKASATGEAAPRTRRYAGPCAPCAYRVEPSALVQGLGILQGAYQNLGDGMFKFSKRHRIVIRGPR
jgi:RNA recognition motif. (a.k.a. RRM, RBD, or RNP domain)